MLRTGGLVIWTTVQASTGISGGLWVCPEACKGALVLDPWVLGPRLDCYLELPWGCWEAAGVCTRVLMTQAAAWIRPWKEGRLRWHCIHYSDGTRGWAFVGLFRPLVAAARLRWRGSRCRKMVAQFQQILQHCPRCRRARLRNRGFWHHAMLSRCQQAANYAGLQRTCGQVSRKRRTQGRACCSPLRGFPLRCARCATAAGAVEALVRDCLGAQQLRACRGALLHVVASMRFAYVAWLAPADKPRTIDRMAA